MKKLLLSSIIFIAFAMTSSCEEPSHECGANEIDRIGAVCLDGSTSSSTGSGTCSSHGGVDYWLCGE